MPNRAKVLVVDDNREIVFGTTLRLRSAGYVPLNAFDGREAVRVARGERPDVIILDVLMPKMNGLETLSELKQHRRTKHIPVLVLSASLRDRRPALDAGARFFLTKPCPSDELLKAVSAAMSDPVTPGEPAP